MLTDELLNAVDVTAPKQVCGMDRIPFKTSDAFFFSFSVTDKLTWIFTWKSKVLK